MIILFAVMVSILGVDAKGSPLTLDEALSLARKNAPELKEAGFTESQFLASSSEIDGLFDTVLFSDLQNINDKSESTSSFAGDSRTAQKFSIGAKKLFSSGTRILVKVERNREELFFPNPEPSSTPEQTANPSTTSSSFNSSKYNPSYSTKYGIEIRQELWRNFFTREISLQKIITGSGTIGPKFSRLIQYQTIQANVEAIYWQLKFTREQRQVSVNLLDEARAFAKQMEKRVELGRADSVELASADAMVVSQETTVLNLDLYEKKLSTQLAVYTDPTFGKNGGQVSIGELTAKESDIPAKDYAAAIKIASTNRYDLKMLEEQMGTVTAKRDLANEKGKPTLAVFGKAETSGMDDSDASARKKAGDFKQPTYAVGLSLEVPLGGTESASSVLAANFERESLLAKRDRVLRDLERDIAIIFNEIAGSERMIDLAQKKIITFRKKTAQENFKLKQARSDLVSVLRYEMEVLAATIDKINAEDRKRAAETQLRLLLHSYPSES